jgi:hypothetical protein
MRRKKEIKKEERGKKERNKERKKGRKEERKKERKDQPHMLRKIESETVCSWKPMLHLTVLTSPICVSMDEHPRKLNCECYVT